MSWWSSLHSTNSLNDGFSFAAKQAEKVIDITFQQKKGLIVSIV
jgi:hypothetical protein